MQDLIPPELGRLQNLVSLDLSQNRLVGPVPPELGSLPKLREMRLDGNELSLTAPDTPLPFEPAGSGSGSTQGDPRPPVSGGRLSDEDGTVHEANVEIIEALGIAGGCNPPAGDRFCPGVIIGRAQLMDLLARPLGGANQPTGGREPSATCPMVRGTRVS